MFRWRISRWRSGCVRGRWMNSSARKNCSVPGKPLRVQIENDDLGSMLLLGTAGLREDDAGAVDRALDEFANLFLSAPCSRASRRSRK